MDPRVAELRSIFDAFGFHTADLASARASFRATCETFPIPDGVDIATTTVAGRPALRVRRSRTDGRRILHLHGGAFVIADLDVQLTVPALLATATGAEVVSLDYRVAPEHPCPAATDDAVAAYLELLEDGPVTAIAGESAGGTLAVLTAVALRDLDAPLPQALITLSPWVDLWGASHRWADPSVVDPVLSREFLTAAATAWRGSLAPDDPRLTPANASLRDLPPTLIHVGGDELLLDDALDLAHQLAESGGHVELRVFPAMPHVFTAYPTLAPECDQSLDAVVAFLNDWSGPPTVSATSSSPT